MSRAMTFAAFERLADGGRRRPAREPAILTCSECGGQDYEHELWCTEGRRDVAGDAVYHTPEARPATLVVWPTKRVCGGSR